MASKAEKSINKVILYLNILPVIKTIVDNIERLADGSPMSGAEKKATALETLREMWDGIGVFGKVKELQQVPFDAVEPMVSSIIDLVVTLSNMLGRFFKK